MKNKCKVLIFIMTTVTALGWARPLAAQTVMTLDECRHRALEANKGLKIQQEKVAEADALEKMALSQFFPKLSVNGTYIWNQKNVRLLSDEQEDRINHMGTTATNRVETNVQERLEARGMDPGLAAELASLFGRTDAEADLNAVGRDITDAMNINMTHLVAGAATVTQPLYMGGKLRALYKSAHAVNELAQIQYSQKEEEQLIAVDEAYWRVISLQHKQRLAQQYCDLLTKLSQDVDAMVDAEVATQADRTKVRVKLNEAQMNLTKASNGVTLSRMLLNQMCGLPLNAEYELLEDTVLSNFQPMNDVDMQQVWDNRKEMKMLQLSDKMAEAGVQAATAALLPNVGLTGSYVVTNPNMYNGFQKEFGGMFTAGVVVNIPIGHADAIYALKAAKHRRKEVQYQVAEAQEKIELQVNKLNFELQVANEKMRQAQSNLANAEENLRLADESFKAGVASASDLMQAQTAWLSARTEVSDAEIEIRMSHLYLCQAIGATQANQDK